MRGGNQIPHYYCVPPALMISWADPDGAGSLFVRRQSSNPGGRMSRQFHCPNCGQPITTDWSKPGEAVACRFCGADVGVPPAGEDYDTSQLAAAAETLGTDGDDTSPAVPDPQTARDAPYELFRPPGGTNPDYPLHPMKVSELLDRAFTMYRRHFGLLFGIVIVAFALPCLFFAAGYASGGGGAITLVVLGGAMFCVAYIVSQAAVVQAVSALLLGETLSIREAYARVGSQVLGLILLIVLMGLGIFCGALLLIIPGIVLGIRWAVAIPAMTIEFSGPMSTLRRSAFLTKGHAKTVCLLGLMGFALTMAMSGMLETPFAILIALHVGGPGAAPALLVLKGIANLAVNAIVIPFSSTMYCLLYYDLRIRKEGFDLEQMIGSLKRPTPAVPASSVA